MRTGIKPMALWASSQFEKIHNVKHVQSLQQRRTTDSIPTQVAPAAGSAGCLQNRLPVPGFIGPFREISPDPSRPLVEDEVA